MKERLDRVLARLEHFRATRLERNPSFLDAAFSLSDDEIDTTLVAHRPPPLLFGTFSEERVMADLERCGIIARCLSLGYRDLRAEFSGRDAFETRFGLLGDHPELDAPGRLLDIRTHQGELRAMNPLEDDEEICVRALLLDWISMEDPAHPLSTETPSLPGQRHPGLGLFRDAYRLTLGYLRQTDFDGVVNVPEHFHNAVLYGRDFAFFSPQRQGSFLAMKRDLLKLGLARASRALSPSAQPATPDTEGVELVEQTNRVQWTPAEQVLALRAPLRRIVDDPRYHAIVDQARAANHYRLRACAQNQG
ncbi:MAG: hypothetical protein EB084_22220 [Proteobacteria bacterium]|nr:hypothetical protein [Pseudomonadota bacterium]